MTQVEKYLSVSELAALSGVSEKTVRNEIHRRIISVPHHGTERKHWTFPLKAVAYFMLVSEMPLPRQDRQALYKMIATEKASAGRWRRRHRHRFDRGDLVSLNAQRIVSNCEKNIRTYHKGLSRIESRPDVLSGEEVFKGTRLSVRHIGNMIRKGVSIEEIRVDYPDLTKEDILFAAIYAAIKRPPGRPTKQVAFRRVLAS
jgi:uncharacterized protein (DUF433 family)